MRKVTLSEFISLDGVIENPSWTAPYWNDKIGEFKFAELFSHDALLLGRITYEGFAAAWPTQLDEQGYGDRMNNLPKHVVTTTLDKADWTNSSVVKGAVYEQIARLKEQPGQDILIFGSVTLATSLMERGLIDQYNLIVYPVVLGSGRKLFNDGIHSSLKLVESRPFDTGAIALVYQPAPQEAK